MSLPADIPPEAVSFLETMGYLEPDRLAVGAPAPRLELPRLDATGTVVIGTENGSRPMVLIFGSYT